MISKKEGVTRREKEGICGWSFSAHAKDQPDKRLTMPRIPPEPATWEY
jgi:hypothetical protein